MEARISKRRPLSNGPESRGHQPCWKHGYAGCEGWILSFDSESRKHNKFSRMSDLDLRINKSICIQMTLEFIYKKVVNDS